MMRLQNERVSLRAIEHEDIDVLFNLENDVDLWKYSNRFQPFSKDLLKNYIANAHKDFFDIRQVKFSIVDQKKTLIGFIDLFDHEPLHHRAGVGLVVQKENRGKGYGTAALELIGDYAKNHLQLHQLYVNIAVENKISIQLFVRQGYFFAGTKKDWNFYEGQFHDESVYQKII